MIKLTRNRANAVASLCGAKREEKELELLTGRRDLLAAGTGGSQTWSTTYWKAGKDTLRAESEGKCAYCESPTAVVAHGDVEHFRPKSNYWWLAYCLDNHLYACQICNQSFKGDQFPVQGAPMTGPTVRRSTSDIALTRLVGTFAPDPVQVLQGCKLKDFVKACLQEKPGLPDPYNVNPEPMFRWEADETNKEVWIRPRTNSARNKFIIESVEAYMGLNREELRRVRWTLAYAPLARLKSILDQLQSTGMADVIQITRDSIGAMMASNQPYAAMVRYFVNDAWDLQIPVQ